ncbi:hypothetical protein FHS43_003197 [Streptosporangium becharense]|uniref:Amino acid transporter n=1 Tax=Streptosporangium becharense TaxID=1816182 RepID=A0A7W9ID05_9ACTN|nr:DUF1648 domain-containing protein [Streptosporangium becharense]MBB2911917.1 hypothetical protein [Streptosporangium becharense]MBB5818464.1 amino acid transporter [Streptosporangium becharense]
MGLRGRFLVMATVWFALVTITLVAVPFALRDRLPDPVAVHWGLSGAPDRSASFAVALLVGVGLWAAIMIAACTSAVGRARVLGRRAGRTAVGAMLGGGGLFVLGLQAATVWANLDVPDWREAGDLAWGAAVPFAGLLAGAALGALVARPGPDEVSPSAGVPERRIRLRGDQRAVWVSSLRNGWLTAVGVAALTAGAALCVFALTGDDRTLLIPAGITLVVGLVGVTFSSVQVQITDDGLSVSHGPLRLPRRRIPLAKVERAWSEELFPSQVGGWGMRGLPGSSTVMLRGGECLVVGYVSGGRFAISVDDADSGAALLNTLVAKHATGSASRH